MLFRSPPHSGLDVVHCRGGVDQSHTELDSLVAPYTLEPQEREIHYIPWSLSIDVPSWLLWSLILTLNHEWLVQQVECVAIEFRRRYLSISKGIGFSFLRINAVPERTTLQKARGPISQAPYELLDNGIYLDSDLGSFCPTSAMSNSEVRSEERRVGKECRL